MGNQQENRYTDQGQEPDLQKDTLGALERKLREGDNFVTRSTDAPEFVTAVEQASKTFQLRTQAATGNTGADTVQTTNPAEATKPELTPEQAWFGKFKTRFDALPQLHQGVQWADVEKSLKADAEQLRKLQILDEKGHDMNVFGGENGEFIFASGWSDYNKVSPEHRNIAYDLEGKKLAERQGYKPRGNAVDIIESIGADLADPKFHRQLIQATNVNGWAWLKTDAATRKSGYAFYGNYLGFNLDIAYYYNDNRSFRASLRVKKS